MPAIDISAANETQEIGAWDAHTIRSASLEAASDVPGASAAHELDLIDVQAEAAVPAMPVQAGGGTTTKADVQDQHLDVAEMVNIILTRDQLRRQAKADARRQKRPLVDRSAEELATRAQTDPLQAGSKDNAENASEPQERPDVDRSGENFAKRASTNRKHNTAGAT